jgi:hypothetical protein
VNITSRSCGLLIFVQVVAVFFVKRTGIFLKMNLRECAGYVKNIIAYLRYVCNTDVDTANLEGVGDARSLMC